ncbi:aldo-keto reductase 1B-like [Arctopsyche grandis]|uniref:aldo-keto reductase 1B-like n=1 Tax=Arctopsyche grandis TaxID=121162 RepID=UPI00406D821A
MTPSIVPTVKFNDGNAIPIFGLGTWKSKPGEVDQAVKDAIDIGYRHIDGAHVYGNEKEIGNAIAAKIEEGIVKREDLYIVSKLWHTFHNPELVEKGCRRSLEDLGLEYLDLYLIHHPVGFVESDELIPTDANGALMYSNVDYVDTWLAMEKLVTSGLVKSIGISNFNHLQIERILSVATIVPVTNQVECHPYLSQKRLGDWMVDRNITLTAYSPLGSPDRPTVKPDDPDLLADPRLLPLAEKYNKTPAQILLRYHIERGFIVVAKSVSKERLRQNFEIFDFKISPEDMKTLMSFENNLRYFKMEIFGVDHQDYPFKAEF